MEIDNDSDSACRKRSLPQSKAENSGCNKSKKPTCDVSNALKDSLNNSHDKPTILYSTSDSPPYLIHVYSTADEAPSGSAYPLLISRTLSQLAYADIKEIKKIGKGKVLVEMKSAKAANKLIQDPNLEKHKLKAFVPLYRTIRSGIVRDIPQYLEEADILQFLDSPFKVIEVKRLNRRMKINGEVKYISSRTVCLNFTGQILPKYVFLCRNRYEVSPYISKIKICYACYRIGHISKKCRGNSKCIFCGRDAHDSSSLCPQENNNPCSINCRGGHLATSHDCPLTVRHKLILFFAASENIPLIDARRIIL